MEKLVFLSRDCTLAELDSEEVRCLQTQLVHLGFLVPSMCDGIVGPVTKGAWASWKASKHLGFSDLIGPASVKLLYSDNVQLLISKETLKRCLPVALSKDIDDYFVPLNSAMKEFEINNPKRKAAFNAQIAHESASLRYKEEIATGDAYEGRKDLGNVNPGDGRKYKGRGIIQLTGRANYRRIGTALGIDLEETPSLVTKPFHSARIAGYFWKSHGLNKLADAERFQSITRCINGGLNGFADRWIHWERCKKVLY